MVLLGKGSSVGTSGDLHPGQAPWRETQQPACDLTTLTSHPGASAPPPQEAARHPGHRPVPATWTNASTLRPTKAAVTQHVTTQRRVRPRPGRRSSGRSMRTTPRSTPVNGQTSSAGSTPQRTRTSSGDEPRPCCDPPEREARHGRLRAARSSHTQRQNRLREGPADREAHANGHEERSGRRQHFKATVEVATQGEPRGGRQTEAAPQDPRSLDLLAAPAGPCLDGQRGCGNAGTESSVAGHTDDTTSSGRP